MFTTFSLIWTDSTVTPLLQFPLKVSNCHPWNTLPLSRLPPNPRSTFPEASHFSNLCEETCRGFLSCRLLDPHQLKCALASRSCSVGAGQCGFRTGLTPPDRHHTTRSTNPPVERKAFKRDTLDLAGIGWEFTLCFVARSQDGMSKQCGMRWSTSPPPMRPMEWM